MPFDSTIIKRKDVCVRVWVYNGRRLRTNVRMYIGERVRMAGCIPTSGYECQNAHWRMGTKVRSGYELSVRMCECVCERVCVCVFDR